MTVPRVVMVTVDTPEFCAQSVLHEASICFISGIVSLLLVSLGLLLLGREALLLLLSRRRYIIFVLG